MALDEMEVELTVLDGESPTVEELQQRGPHVGDNVLAIDWSSPVTEIQEVDEDRIVVGRYWVEPSNLRVHEVPRMGFVGWAVVNRREVHCVDEVEEAERLARLAQWDQELDAMRERGVQVGETVVVMYQGRRLELYVKCVEDGLVLMRAKPGALVDGTPANDEKAVYSIPVASLSPVSLGQGWHTDDGSDDQFQKYGDIQSDGSIARCDLA